jgi:tRNA threonylcarbamoyladenosine biosynthesis protein TsaB
MLTLAIETSSPHASIALTRNGQLLAELTQAAPDAHAEALLPLLGQLLAQAQVERGALQRVAVGLGPGSFTGLRVGIAFAQGIALGLKLPAVGVPSLAALAWQGRRQTSAQIMGAVLDARRDELFFAAYEEAGLVTGPHILQRASAADQIRQLLGGRPFGLAGHAAREIALPGWLVADVECPSAAAVASLAGSSLATTDLSALYLRAPDVKLPSLPPNPLRRAAPESD